LKIQDLKEYQMADAKQPQPSLFQKIIEAGNALLDTQIMKAKTQILNADVDDNFLYSKAITEDPNYSTHAQGFKDKPYRIQNSHLKQMSTQDSVVAGIIQTRQNQVAAHSKLVKAKQEKGFMICLRDEDALLAKIKEELKLEMESQKHPITQNEDGQSEETPEIPQDLNVQKATSPGDGDLAGNTDMTSFEGTETSTEDDGKEDDEVEEFDWELDRKARAKLSKQFEPARKSVEEYLLNCGKVDQREFSTKRWTFDGALRAWTRDSLTYDLYATEIVPDRAGRPHHWFPVDGGSIKYSSAQLKNYKDMAENFINMDILYPENLEVAEEKQKVIDLNPKLLELDAYKWVQVIRGKVERAYTDDELKVGIRNITTDIYVNGYGVSELELLVSLVTGHLNAEYYNQAYFTQGFSAKGILHIKAAIPRRKLESVRQEWQYMIKGARNSFQTPIFAGLDDVKWIPLTQNHNDIGFEGWMRYLVTLISCIYQIDPVEMGIHFKSEGGGGSLNSNDKSSEKISQSKDKGLYPLLRHFEHYISENVIKPFDARFVIKFTGMTEETETQQVERQSKEVKFKKTVNEIRAEDGLPPLPGMDEIILDPQYMAWFTQFSKKGQNLAKKNQQNQMKQQQMSMPPSPSESEEEPKINPEADIYGNGAHLATNPMNEEVTKSNKSKTVSVEIYKIDR
jgi:hypothetical protein